jgi:hypothetical protein
MWSHYADQYAGAVVEFDSGHEFFAGLKIARRGYPDTPEAGTWVPIEPGWEVKDVLGGDEIWVRYTNPVSGEVITFPEGGRQ